MENKHRFVINLAILYGYLRNLRYAHYPGVAWHTAEKAEKIATNIAYKMLRKATGAKGVASVQRLLDPALTCIRSPFYSERGIDEVWKRVLALDFEVHKTVSEMSFRIQSFDETKTITSLLDIDITHQPPIGQGFYLYCLSDMVENIHVNTVVKIRIHDLVTKYQAFVRVPINASDALHPITGKMGQVGGKSSLNRLIGEYAARLPTRAEMMAHLQST